MNPDELSRALQQAWIDELSGTPRQSVPDGRRTPFLNTTTLRAQLAF